MANDVNIDVGIRGDVSGGRTIKRSLDDVSKSADKATKETGRLENQTKSLSRAANVLKTAFAGLVAGLSVRQLGRVSDQFTILETQLKNVTDGTRQYNRVFNDLFTIAQKTGDSFSDLTSNYVRLNNSLPEAVKNTTDLVKVTETLSRGFAASGTNAQTASQTLTQITQGLAGNFQNAAQELNSLVEGSPLLAKTIAVELGGKAATDLKKFAKQGKLTTETFLEALLSAREAIFEFKIPPTIGRSVQRLRNEFLKLVGQSDTIEGASNNIASAIDNIAGNLGTAIKLVGVLAGASVPFFASKLPAAIALTTTAFKSLTAAIAANPFGAIAVGVSAAVSAIVLFRKEIKTALDNVNVFGVSVGDILTDIAVGAEIIFKSVGNTIGGFFAGVFNVIKGLIDKLKVQIFQLTDSLAQSGLGSRLGIGTVDLIGSDAIGVTRRANQSIAQNFRAGASGFSGFELSNRANEVLGISTNSLPEVTDPDSPESIASGLNKTTEAAKELTNEIERPMSDAVSDLSKDIERDLAGAFKDAFSDSSGSFKRFIAGMKSSFTDFLGEIAYQAAARPIMLSLGVAGGAGAAQAAGSAGAAGAGGGLNLLSLGRSALGGLNNPIFGTGSFVGQGINAVGNSLGLANNAVFAGGGFGPAAPLSTAFTAGAGIAGFGGNFLANSLFGGDRGIGASIGGGVGGAVGTAVGASTLGAALGSFGGPVGALVGGFLGNAVGGLFGNSEPSDKAQAANVDLSTASVVSRGGQTGKKFSQKNRDFVDKVADQAADLAGLLQSAGAELSGNVRPIVGQRDGLRLGSFSNNRNFGYNNKAFLRAVNQGVIGGITSAPENLQTALSNVDQGSIKAITEAVNLVKIIDSFQTTENVAPLRDALDSLEAQFESLRDKAVSLGLPVDKLTESYENQREAIVDDALRPLQNFLDQQALSGESSFSPTERLSLARSRFDNTLQAVNDNDLSQLGNLTGQASTLLSAGRDVFASGEGFASLEQFVRQSIAGVGETLGAPGGSLETGIAQEISISNAEQTSILEQISLELQSLREENRRLRKSTERFGNAVVRMSS